jgi:di/tricarboxylate transporter
VVLWVSGIVSGFLDNIPFTITMIPIVRLILESNPIPNNILWWALSLGACLGGNLTMIGASANIVSVGMAKKFNQNISFLEFMKASPVIIFIVCIGLTFLTEVTSNTATTQMILPILAALSLDMKINPLFLMIPATLSASCAFMLPVATPPNAIIFGSGRVKIAEMARAGIFINIIGAVFITLFFYFIGTSIFSIDPSVLPDWAQHLGSVKQ